MLSKGIKEKSNAEKEMEPPNKKAKTIYKRCAECTIKKDRKTNYFCEKCPKSIFMEHMISVCRKCHN